MEFRYVEWIDGAWLASDARGCLAAMVTAGPGPIAAWTLGDGYDDFDIEERLLALPINGQAQSVAAELDYPSFFALAERGLSMSTTGRMPTGSGWSIATSTRLLPSHRSHGR